MSTDGGNPPPLFQLKKNPLWPKFGIVTLNPLNATMGTMSHYSVNHPPLSLHPKSSLEHTRLQCQPASSHVCACLCPTLHLIFPFYVYLSVPYIQNVYVLRVLYGANFTNTNK